MPVEIGRFKNRVAQTRVSHQALSVDRKTEQVDLIDFITNQMDEDYQVMLARRTLDAQVKSIPVTFASEGVPSELTDEIEALWRNSLNDMLGAIAKGRVAFEKVWSFERGMTIVRKLEALPYSKTRMKLNAKGEFDGITLKPKKGEPAVIPEGKSWWLALDPDPLEPHGRSRYMGAPRAIWEIRKKSLRMTMIHTSRFALGWALARARAVVENEDGEIVDNWDAIAKAYFGVTSSEYERIMFLSNEKDGEGEYVDDFQQQPEIEDGSPLLEVLNELDARQIRAFGFSEKTVTEGSSVGSFAMVKEQTSLLVAVALGILKQFADSFQKYVVDKILEFNTLSGSITIQYPDVADLQDSAIVEIVRSIIESPRMSPLIKSGAVDLGQMLRSVGIPVADDLDAILAQLRKRK